MASPLLCVALLVQQQSAAVELLLGPRLPQNIRVLLLDTLHLLGKGYRAIFPLIMEDLSLTRFQFT